MRVNLLVLVFIVLTLSGCASNKGWYVSENTITDPRDIVAGVRSMRELKESGVKNRTFIKAYASSIHEVELGAGTWPVEAVCPGGTRLKGQTIPEQTNPGGKVETVVYHYDNKLRLPAWQVFDVSLAKLDGCYLIGFNHDAGWAMTMLGEVIYDAPKADDPSYLPLAYDIELYDKEPAYRWQFAQRHGMSIDQIREYFDRQGYNATGKDLLINQQKKAVIELEVGSMVDYKLGVDMLKEFFPHVYKLPGGDRRLSSLDLESYTKFGYASTGLTATDRFFDSLILPLNPLVYVTPIGGASLGLGTAIGVYRAIDNDVWRGQFYARAQVPVYNSITALNIVKRSMVERFKLVTDENQSLRETNKSLQAELLLYKGNQPK
jgi:hypothetical protein